MSWFKGVTCGRWRLVAITGAATISLALGCTQQTTDVSELSAQLSEPDAEDRYDAAKELEHQVEQLDASEAALIVPALREALRDSDPRVRYRAAKALSKLEVVAAPAVEELALTLEDEDPDVRYYSAKALYKIGRPARPAISALISALADDNEDVKYYAVKALGKIGPSAHQAAAPLEQLTLSRNVKVQEAAKKALERIQGSES